MPISKFIRAPRVGPGVCRAVIVQRLRPGGLRVIAVVALVLAWAGAASTQTLPSGDTSFTRRSADNDPDLVVAREGYDAQTRTQSLYLRVNDGTPDRQTFSGLLIVRGADVVRVVTDPQELSDTDARWGIAGMEYAPAPLSRGLDGVDPSSHVPVVGDVEDAVRIEDTSTVRFWMGTGAGVDDLRVLIRYPAEPGPANFDVLLFHPERPDPLGWQVTTQGGIQIGNLVDSVPDDGDYSEVFDVHRIKLRIEDLDVAEEGLDFGIAPLTGATLGPLDMTLDNFAEGTDFDQDNGFDQNGLISPIPAGSDLEHLVFTVPVLFNAPQNATLPPDAVALENPPARLAVGERIGVPVRVVVPPDMPPGAYVGRMEVFEDNNRDGLRGGAEPADFVSLTVFVVEPPDAGYDLGPLPDFLLPDGAPRPDLSGPDATSPRDAGFDVVADGPPGADGGPDASPGDVRPSDGAPPADGPAVHDLSFDATDLADAAGDAGSTGDAVPPGADGPTDYGTPRGGAFNCRTAGGLGSVWLALALAGALRSVRLRPGGLRTHRLRARALRRSRRRR